MKQIKSQAQEHLQYKEYVNLGSYYTPNEIVQIVYDMLRKHINNTKDFVSLDSSCGYGAFLGSDLFKRNILQYRQ